MTVFHVSGRCEMRQTCHDAQFCVGHCEVMERAMGIKLKDVKVGDILIADGGFTCIKAGEQLEVFQDEDGQLCVRCSQVRHYLVGQLDAHGELSGFSRPPEPTPQRQQF